MAETGFRTIVLQSGLLGVPRLELLAGEANIKPGHLLAISSGKVIKHATADGVQQRLVALESQNADADLTASVDTVYANGDTVYYTSAQPGDVLYMLLAVGVSTTLGVTPLVSNGDGTLKNATVDANTLSGAVVGIADQTVVGGGSVTRCKVRIV